MTFGEGTALREGLTANQPSAGKPLTSVISCHFTFRPDRRGRIKAETELSANETSFSSLVCCFSLEPDENSSTNERDYY